MPAFQDLTGKPFGYLIVQEFAGMDDRAHTSLWLCECICGDRRIYRANNLRSKNTRSCGCAFHRERHGLTDVPEYHIWTSMRQRCYDSNCKSFKNYGGRGIDICEDWRHSFARFYADMGPRPSPKHTIERRLNNAGYSKDNCYWATYQEQRRNTRHVHLITLDGITACLTDWLAKLGIPRVTYYRRIARGWSEEQALLTPPDPKHRRKS